MGSLRVRHLVAKLLASGATIYYWQPSALLRKAGFRPRRIARETNDPVQAHREAEELNAGVDRWRAGNVPEPVQPDSLPWLIRLYKESELWEGLAPKTQRSYGQTFKALEDWSKSKGHPRIQGLTRKAVQEFYRSMKERPAWAAAVIRVLRLLLNFARDEGLIGVNPAERPRVRTVAPRSEFWDPAHLEAFNSAAAALGRPSMALAVLLGASLAQREADILALGWSQFDGQRFRVRQRKTGALLEVPATEDLRALLATTKRSAVTIVVSETTGRPYREDHFRHEFSRVRAKAALPATLQFRDLRRTAVVRLAEAGCTVPEIAAISGHEIQTTARILEVYCPRTPEMARNAIVKLEGHRRRNAGETKV